MKSGLKFAAATAALLTCGGGAALAQGDAGSGGDQIVVTATKRAESIQDVSSSIVAVTPEQLDAAGVVNVEDIGNVAPSVLVDSNANFVAPYIRGIGTQYASPGLEPSVSIYIDDIYLSRASAGFLLLSDIERVEILKGPQGTLYGQSNTGGAIRIITKEPTSEFSAGGSFSFGNRGQKVGDVYFSGPITDTLAARISAQVDSNDGWVKSIDGSGPTAESRNLGTVHGKLAWRPTDQLTVRLMGDYSRKKDHEGQGFIALYDDPSVQLGLAFGGQGASGIDFYGENLTNDLTMNLTVGGAELRADYDFDGVTVSSITGYRYTKFIGYADLDNTTAPLLHAQTNQELTNSFTQEIQAVSDLDGPFNYTLGLYYYNEWAEDGVSIGGLAINAASMLPLTPPFAAAYGLGKVEYRSIAPYANIEYALSDQIEFVVGGRFTSNKKTLESNTLFGGVLQADGFSFDRANSLALATEGPRDFKSNNFSPKAGINWTPTDNVLVYFSYNRGNKAGGFNLPQPTGLVDQVDDETLNAFELGWKTSTGPLTFNGAVYHYRAKDLQVQITDPSAGVIAVTNAGSSETTGVETELNWAVTDGFNIGGNVSYTDSKFTDFPNAPINVPCNDPATLIAAGQNPAVLCAGGGLATYSGDVAGNRLPFAPKWSGNIYANFVYDVPGDAGSISMGLVASYKGDHFFTPDNNFSQDAYWLLSGAVGYTLPSDHFKVEVYGSNLTDKGYLVHVGPFSTGGWKTRGAPRLYGVRLSADF